MYSLGIDIGYSSIKLALINSHKEIVYNTYILHKGRMKETLRRCINELVVQQNVNHIGYGAVTGSGSKFLAKTAGITYTNEVSAIVEGSLAIRENIGSIIEIGGQSAKFITDFRGDDKSRIKISMNSSCSAGTGSFLEEQVSRLDLRLEDYSVYAGRATSIPRIAGRCSVFAKTDITHHQQEGVAVEDILLGLAYAVVKNYKGAVMKKLPVKKPILFVGGVAHNQGIITALRDVLHVDDDGLIIPEYFSHVGAVGAAILAQQDHCHINWEKLFNALKNAEDPHDEVQKRIVLPRLVLFGKDDSVNKHVCQPGDRHNGNLECYLGIDVGSTSTNLVLMNKTYEIVAYQYLKTFGNPVEAVKTGLKQFNKEFGNRLSVLGVGTTGSGRYLIGKFVGADVVKDEITAQAKAAVTIEPSVDTIFEIGGQDSKFIRLEDGVVTDFQMNKICAAGTGSFLEEQAKKLNIPIDDFGTLALSSQAPLNLGERCTVFIETSVAAHLARGVNVDDIASGLCYSIAKNYLHRVVGQKPIGRKIFFQGGVAHNQGVINAFKSLTGKDIIIPPFFSVTGAYGAAILAKEGMPHSMTTFKGFDIGTAEPCLEDQGQSPSAIDNTGKFNRRVEELIFEGYNSTLDSNKQTVGIPRALFTFGMFPMFHAFFKELGFNVLMSEPTSEETIRLGQEYSLDETCYPVKLINGHVAELVQKQVDYIFFPDLYTVDHPGSEARQNYGCAYMQLAFKVVNQAMELSKQGIKLLAPTIAFNQGKEFMMKSFSGLGKQLGKSPEETGRALQKGMQAFQRFEKRIEENGKKVLKSLRPDEKTFVLISKIYGVADPVLNMGIPGKLMDMGYHVVPFYDLPEGDVSQEHPNMYWPFGQHILEPAYLVKHHPNLYAILLTHHGCGPDSVLSHFFREIMDGKPYLNIEVDEHSSGVGVITRLEAFVNSLKDVPVQHADAMETYVEKVTHKKVNIKTHLNELPPETTVYIPYMYPYSEIFRDILMTGRMPDGMNVQVLPMTNQASVDLGRTHTVTNEYFSLTTLLGDVLNELHQSARKPENPVAVFIPQTEGAEVEGQYNRFLRTKLDEEGFQHVDIVAPFIEDALCNTEEEVYLLFLGLLAGDLVRMAVPQYREKHLANIRELITTHCFELNALKEIARDIDEELRRIEQQKRVFVTGEPMLLFNDFMNDFTFRTIEENGHQVVYSPFSEALWMFWRDYADQNMNERTPILRQRLDELAGMIQEISGCLSENSPFEKHLNDLIAIADNTVGYYAGAYGRYRQAKLLDGLEHIDGIITATSTYENTGITLNILQKVFEHEQSKPILNLTFDGNKNENDETKVESFLYYI